MKRVTPALVTLLMLGVVGFLVVAYVAKKYLFASTAETPPVSRRNVPTAIVEIPAGTIITEKHLGVAPIRVDKIDAQTLVSSRAILGRVAKQTIKPLHQISTADLYPPGDGPRIEIEDGMRAITVQLGEQADVVDNLVRPGQFVDVHFHVAGTEDRRLRRGLVMTLFEGVKVLAINRSFQPTNPDRGTTTVTFELTEEQANIMLVARDHGNLTLAYTPEGRGHGGVAVTSADRAYLEEVLGLEPLPEPKKPFRAFHYNGSSHRVEQFLDGVPVGGAYLPGRNVDAYQGGYGYGDDFGKKDQPRGDNPAERIGRKPIPRRGDAA